MSEANIFDELMQQNGGRLDRETMIMPKKAKAFYKEIEDYAAELIASARTFIPKLPPIHFDFVHNAQVNAVAFRSHWNTVVVERVRPYSYEF